MSPVVSWLAVLGSFGKFAVEQELEEGGLDGIAFFYFVLGSSMQILKGKL
jgi:hypothetical protein